MAAAAAPPRRGAGWERGGAARRAWSGAGGRAERAGGGARRCGAGPGPGGRHAGAGGGPGGRAPAGAAQRRRSLQQVGPDGSGAAALSHGGGPGRAVRGRAGSGAPGRAQRGLPGGPRAGRAAARPGRRARSGSAACGSRRGPRAAAAAGVFLCGAGRARGRGALGCRRLRQPLPRARSSVAVVSRRAGQERVRCRRCAVESPGAAGAGAGGTAPRRATVRTAVPALSGRRSRCCAGQVASELTRPLPIVVGRPHATLRLPHATLRLPRWLTRFDSEGAQRPLSGCKSTVSDETTVTPLVVFQHAQLNSRRWAHQALRRSPLSGAGFSRRD